MYVAITATSYPLRHAHALLESVQQAFAGRAVDKALAAREGSLNGEFRANLARILAQYDDMANVDNLKATMGKVHSFKPF